MWISMEAMRLKKGKIKKNLGRHVLCGLIVSLLSQSTFAAPVPAGADAAKSIGSVQPGVIGSQLQSNQPAVPQAAAPLSAPPEKPGGSLGPEAEKIKFKLTNIILEDNRVYSTAQLRPIYADKLNKVITIAQLQDIVQNLTNYYRNNGYILSRAVIPPQHVVNGIVRIRLIEGFVDKVNVVGTPMGARYIVTAYGRHISDARPLQLKTMEKYLLLANELPGVQTKAILEPSKTVGASDLNLAVATKMLSGFFSYDNYGTRYIGPQQLTAGASANSFFRSGDITSITYVTTARGNELQYKDGAYEMPLGTKGARWAFDINESTTNPLYMLQDLKIAGLANDYNTTLRYPAIRSRSRNLTLEAGFNYLDSYVTQFDSPLYTDHIRELKLAATYDFADRFRGSNLWVAGLNEGLPVFGQTNDPQSLFTSRYGATNHFTKITAQASRIQQLFWKLSLYGLVKGQYSFQPLLASEQFAFGGSQLGRGYDPAEIIADRGLGGTLELRLDTAVQKFLIQTIQFYTFYDAGDVWNLRNVQGTPTRQSATSTGIGARFYMTRYISGNFMFAQPLSRKVQSLELIGNGSLPRTFFSITAVI
jgi:hemolysin activation/secretion protein